LLAANPRASSTFLRWPNWQSTFPTKHRGQLPAIRQLHEDDHGSLQRRLAERQGGADARERLRLLSFDIIGLLDPPVGPPK
jgi:hypothetical protein